MQFPKWFPYIWWVLLLVGVGILIYFRWNIIATGHPQVFDTALLAIAAALVLIPFFSELSLLGFTIKQKAEDTRAGAQTTTSEQAGEKEPPATQEPPEDPAAQLRKLQPDDSKDLFGSMWHAIVNGEFECGEEAYKRLQETEPDATVKLNNEATYLYLRYVSGDSNSLDKLIDLSKRTENSPKAYRLVQRFLGLSYEASSNFDKAIDSYQKAIPLCENDACRAQFIVLIAKCLFQVGDRQAAFDNIYEEISHTNDAEATFLLYEGLADLYKSCEEWELRAIALEKALCAKPNDTNARFASAYAYGESKFDSLSILHYKSLLRTQPKNSAALNNIAVQYDRLDMNIIAISNYKKAVELNYTLASANIAYQYMNAGFSEEARRVLDDARKQEEVHPNIGSAMAALSTKEEDEKNKDEQILERARLQQVFMIKFADALFSKAPPGVDLSGNWKSDAGYEVNLTQSGKNLEAIWIQNSKKYKFSGKVNNSSIKARYYRMTYYQQDKELYFTESGDIYAYFLNDLAEMFIMIVEKSGDQIIKLGKLS